MSHLEDVYPLSPLQQGMFFHSLYAPGSGVYIEQFRWGVDGPFCPSTFSQAWNEVVQRHPVLRTAFEWEGLEEPVQVVQRSVTLPFEYQNLEGLGEAAREETMREYLLEDRALGFDFSVAPLTRVALFRFGEKRHEFVWTHHHILLDGWSAANVLEELFRIYEARRRGVEPQLGEVRPYREFVAWLQLQDLQAAEAFWREELRGFREPTPLRVDRGGGAEGFGERWLWIPPTASREIQEWTRRNRLTVNTVTQGMWALLLACYSGRDDVVFGATVSERPAELDGAESIIGLLVNTLPVRVRIDPAKRLGDWLRGLQTRQAHARQFDSTPLVAIQSWSDVPHGVPLFESMLAFENYPRRPLQTAAEVHVHRVQVVEHSHFPLSISAGLAGQLGLLLRYERRRFDDATIERLCGHLRNLFQGLAENPDRRVSELRLLSPGERKRVLGGWGTAVSSPPFQETVAGLFEAQVARKPEAVAVVCSEERVCYRELNVRANRLAHHLHTLGVGPEAKVGLCIERSVDLVVALLAVLKAGGAYVPLDPRYPHERLTFMLDDAGAAVLVTKEALLAALPPRERVVCLDRDAATISEQSPQDPPATADPDNLAYVIYTSGSTGRPKGVMIHHRSVVNLFAVTAPLLEISDKDVWSQFHSCTFDFSVWEIFGALLHGGQVVIVPEEARTSPESFVDLVVSEKVTVLSQTPSAWLQIVPSLCQYALEHEIDLRAVVFGGEALGLPSLEAARKLKSGRDLRFINMYGITEVTVHATHHVLDLDRPTANPPPIGQPIGNTQIYVLDDRLEPVPIGVPGEMFVGGVGLARGYLHRPDLTGERFLPDPFGAPGGRLYRTGDLARFLPDGVLEFLGRTDHQVKVRGYRIEPGEVEAVLAAHPDVREAAVLAQGTPGDVRLIGYITPAADGITTSELREFLRKHLPEYMVPAMFVIVNELPLTPNGKLDRRALPIPGGLRPALAKTYVAPRTPLERLLTDVWAQVLGVQPVGVHDNFFELGGDSIVAIRLVAMLRTQLSVEVSLRELFENPSVEGLATAIDRGSLGQARASSLGEAVDDE
jgi:amino acid adenylation domain-containing protein